MTPVDRDRYEPLAEAALEVVAAYILDTSGPGRAEGWLRTLLKSEDPLEVLPEAFAIH